MFQLSDKLLKKIKMNLRSITLQPAYANVAYECSWTCSGTCDGTCQENCTAYQANMPK